MRCMAGDHRKFRSAESFATTRWSIVISARNSSSPDSRRALEYLCSAYWQPLYVYARRRALDENEAHDWTQAFFSELLEKDYLSSATPERGRFRAFLLTAFKHFLTKEWDKSKAQKRGGGRAPISLDFHAIDSSIQIDPALGLTAEQHYDKQWAIALLDRIIERLKAEFEAVGKPEHFAVLKGFIIGDHVGTTYADAAERLKITEDAAKKAGSRMRSRYRELLREEIAHTVASPDEVDDEIRNLFAILTL
jgi:DNA-directed RNA polymerase specialized sigma24 family protein